MGAPQGEYEPGPADGQDGPVSGVGVFG